jgi:heat shock protein HslJ
MNKTLLILLTTFIFILSVSAQNFTGHWKLKSIRVGGNQAVSIVSPVTLNISKDGKIGGNGGCNSFGGHYKFTKPNKIKFSGIISTQMFCESSLETEKRFLQSLQTSNSIIFKNGELFIENKKMGNSLAFEKDNLQAAGSGLKRVFSFLLTPKDTFNSHYAAQAANNETLLRKILSLGIKRVYQEMFPNQKNVKLMREALTAVGDTTDLPEIISENINGNNASIK